MWFVYLGIGFVIGVVIGFWIPILLGICIGKMTAHGPKSEHVVNSHKWIDPPDKF